MKRKLACVGALLCLVSGNGGASLVSRAGPAEAPLAEALERALADGWVELRIEAECRVEGRLPRVELFTSGVGIWNDERQFRMAREELRSLLVAFRDEGFVTMRPAYGGKGDPVTEGAQPPRLTCRVRLSLDGASAEVVQLQGGRQSVELRRLAGRILDACREKASAGMGAVDLDDGLALVATGALASEAFHVLVSRRPERRPSAEDARGWLLRVDGPTASLLEPGKTQPAVAPLDGAETAALARRLREDGVAGLPLNLYAEDLTDLVVRVLGHEKTVQARRFAGATRATHGDAQARFERILEVLGDCRERWFPHRPREGQP